jgi:hypothetical protein
VPVADFAEPGGRRPYEGETGEGEVWGVVGDGMVVGGGGKWDRASMVWMSWVAVSLVY